MEIVVRPANDRFIEEVVFPAFTLGMTDVNAALQRIAESMHDDRVRVLAETLIELGLTGSFDELRESNVWSELVYRVMFSDWKRHGDGWVIAAETVAGFAGDYEQTLHLALMIEHPDYPYGDDRWAAAQRELFQKRPESQYPLSALISGLWEPRPPFSPEWVLETVGRANQVEDGELTCADWSYRSPSTMRMMNANLSQALSGLLEREADRLPVEVPEADEIKDFWLGKVEEPPLLAVAFSGLGPQASKWVREIGDLAHLIRNAARGSRGLTALITSSSSFRG